MTRVASVSSALIAVALCVGITGCASTYHDRISDIRVYYASDQLDLAAQTIDHGIEKDSKQADVLKLDRSIVELLSGRPDRAEQTLREVRDRMDYLQQTSVAESAVSMMTDDNRLAYAGEDYERIMIRVMLAMSNLMHGGGDVRAYSMQIAQLQNRILKEDRALIDPNGATAEVNSNVTPEGNPQAMPAETAGGTPVAQAIATDSTSRMAIGPYLSAAVIEETFMNRDDLLRDRLKVCSWQPDFRFGQEDLARAQNGIHSQRGNGVLYVFAMVGRGPEKVETVEVPTSEALLIADRILSATDKHTLPPTIAPIVVPRVVLPTRHIDHLSVSVGGNPVGGTGTIADIGLFARTQSEAILNQTVARAVVRRIVKKGTIRAAKEFTTDEKHSPVAVLFDVAGVIWEASERADTRCWGLLPDTIQVIRLELPVGRHEIGLRAVEVDGNLGPEFTEPVEILSGRNTYMLASFPDRIKVGKILTSRSPMPAPQQPAVQFAGSQNTAGVGTIQNQTVVVPSNPQR